MFINLIAIPFLIDWSCVELYIIKSSLLKQLEEDKKRKMEVVELV